MTIRVLHVVSALGGGGVERMLMNYLRALDNADIQFDFIVHGDDVGPLEEAFTAQGCEISHIVPKRESVIRNAIALNRVIREGRYDVVHSHQNLSNFVPLFLALLHRVPLRISHGHGFPESSRVRRTLGRLLSRMAANALFACGDEAGRWLHGKHWKRSSDNVYLMTNALCIPDFDVSVESAAAVRETLVDDDVLMLLQIGRLSPEKNHPFSIELLRELCLAGVDARLVILGNGKEERSLRELVGTLDLDGRVIFCGFRADVPLLMAAADALLFPSTSEGLGIVAIEAQAAGLPVLASLNVPASVAISPLVRRLALDHKQDWLDALQTLPHFQKECARDSLRENGYDIDAAAIDYLEWLKGKLRDRNGLSI